MIRINLLAQKSVRVSGSGVQQLAVFVGIIGVTVGGLFILQQSVEAGVTELTKTEKKLKDDEAKMNQTKQKVEALRTQNEQIEKRAKLIKDLNKVRTGPVRLLREIATLVPKNVWIENFAEASKAVTFSATALSPDAMTEFQRNLEKSPFFYEVRNLGITTQPGTTPGVDVQKFNIAAKVVYAPKSVVTAELDTTVPPPAPSDKPTPLVAPMAPGAHVQPPVKDGEKR